MSTRTITNAVTTAIGQPQITALLFVELDYEEGMVRLTTAGYDMPWNGYTWTGVGMLGAVEAIREDTSLAAVGIKLTLSGVNVEIVSIALQQVYQGRPAKIWAAFVNDSGSIIADPLLIFVGKMDHVEASTTSVVLQLENDMAAWDRPRIRRFTDADQKKDYPSDRGFEYVTQAATSVLSWGRG